MATLCFQLAKYTNYNLTVVMSFSDVLFLHLDNDRVFRHILGHFGRRQLT